MSASPKPTLVVATGFREDGWHSMRFMAENLVDRCLSKESLPFTPRLFEPSLGRKPRWHDRRLSYGWHLPPGQILHLVDQSYGDCLIRARAQFNQLIVFIHDISFWRERNWLNGFFRERIRRGLATADYRIAPSRTVAREIRAELGLTVHRIIPPGIPLEIFPHSQAPRVPGRLLHVGSALFRKGIDRALRFLAGLPEPFHLHHLGGPLREDHLALARLLGVQERLSVKPYLAGGELARAYREAQALIFPSRYEGFGLPPIEARLCGTPAIISHTVPAGEFLARDPGTHIVDFEAFDPGQPADRQKAVWAGFSQLTLAPTALHERAAFGWERASRDFLAIYENLCPPPVRRALG